MGLFGKSKKEREKEYMNRLDVPLCLKEDFELIIDDVFTIMGVGTVATGNISTGMCREGENACVYKTNGGVLETIITTIDIHTKERKSNGCGYKTEHVGLGLRGVSKEQLEKGDRVIVKNCQYVWNVITNSSLPTCPLGEEKSFSQRAFSIYTDIRKLQDKAKTSYTLSTRRLRFGYEQQFSRSTPGACFGVVREEFTAYT